MCFDTFESALASLPDHTFFANVFTRFGSADAVSLFVASDTATLGCNLTASILSPTDAVCRNRFVKWSQRPVAEKAACLSLSTESFERVDTVGAVSTLCGDVSVFVDDGTVRLQSTTNNVYDAKLTADHVGGHLNAEVESVMDSCDGQKRLFLIDRPLFDAGKHAMANQWCHDSVFDVLQTVQELAGDYAPSFANVFPMLLQFLDPRLNVTVVVPRVSNPQIYVDEALPGTPEFAEQITAYALDMILDGGTCPSSLPLDRQVFMQSTAGCLTDDPGRGLIVERKNQTSLEVTLTHSDFKPMTASFVGNACGSTVYLTDAVIERYQEDSLPRMPVSSLSEPLWRQSTPYDGAGCVLPNIMTNQPTVQSGLSAGAIAGIVVSSVILSAAILLVFARLYRRTAVYCASIDEHDVGIDGVVIGRGRFGVVYQGTLTVRSAVEGSVRPVNVAVKLLNDADRAMAHRECEVLSMCRSEHVLHFFGMVEFSSDRLAEMHVSDQFATSAYAIVTELMDMDLATYLAQNRVPSMDVQVKIASDIANGLMYLHHTMRGLMDHSILHCDIKPANILCNLTAGDVRAKIGDYGISAVIDPENQVPFRGGTQSFLDPGIVRDGWEPAQNSSAVKTLDIYAYGLLIMCLLAGVPAPPSEWVDPMIALRDFIEHNDDPRSVGLYSIAWKCVVHAPADRPTAEDLVAELQELQLSCRSDQSNASDWSKMPVSMTGSMTGGC